MTKTIAILILLLSGCASNTSEQLAKVETNFEKNSKELALIEEALCSADINAVLARYKYEPKRLAYLKLCS